MTQSKKKPAARVLELVTSIPWAITEEYLRTIVNVAARDDVFPDALAFKEGQEVQGRDMEIRDGVAIVRVHGPIFRRANLFTMISGGTSAEWLALDLGAAIRDKSVRAIVLDVDSPGGQVNGLSEISETIYRARAEKPIVAYCNDLCASGGYWIASAAESIVTSPTGLLGSIGVIMTHLDDREHLAENGFREIDIVSSQSPKKNPDPATEDGRSQLQQMVDELAAVFINDVARNRGVDAATVIETFGSGNVVLGRSAVEAGMADAVATFEDVIAALQDGLASSGAALASLVSRQPDPKLTATEPSPNSMEESMKDESKETPKAAEPEITVAYVEENHAEIAEHFRAEGRKEGLEAGAEAERERIKSIEALKSPGTEARIDTLKYDADMTAEKAALEIVKAQKDGKQKKLLALKGDEEQLPELEADTDAENATSAQEVQRTVALYRASHGKQQLPA